MGAAPTAKRMTTVVDFYSKVRAPLKEIRRGKGVSDLIAGVVQLPKGAAPKSSGGLNPFARYRQKYFEGDASGAPIVRWAPL